MSGDPDPQAGPQRSRRPTQVRLRWPWWGSAAAVALLATYGWWAVALSPFSWQAGVAIVGAGAVAALAAGASGIGPRRARRPVPGAARWALLAVATAAWQIQAYVQNPRDDHPTISSLTNAALESQAARTAAFVAWVVVAVALVRR